MASITGRTIDVQFLIQPPIQSETRMARTRLADGGTSTKLKEPTKAANLNSLNSRYVFNAFIPGESNRLAYAAALAVAEEPGYTFNPLFIYGDTGVGKTHLLHAIGHMLEDRSLQVLYIHAEQFVNQFVLAVREQKTEDFRHKFRNADTLLVDDIQFLSGKAQTQECFFHIFNDLYDNNCQIVLTSDSPPNIMPSITKRLRSRFEWGLVADMHPPDLDTRLTILSFKAKRLQTPIPPEVLQFLATQFQRNVRELEGALNRVATYAKLEGTELNVRLASQAIQDLVAVSAQQQATSTPKQIIDTVANYYGITAEALTGRRRDKKTNLARQVAMYLLREQNHRGLAKIGKILGDRDHTTILHGCEKIAAEIDINPQLKKSIDDIRHELATKRTSS